MTKVRIHGRERLSGLQGAYIVVSNHSSHLDAPLLITSLPYRLSRLLATGVAMDYFYSSKIRQLPTALVFNSYPIDRSGSGAHRGLSGELLGDGVPLLIFPEGTRSKTGRMARFLPGAASLAISNDVPVIPTALVGAGAAMPRGTSWPKRGRPSIDVVFGTPMLPGPGESARQFSERVRAAVAELHDAKALEVGKPTLEAYARGEVSLREEQPPKAVASPDSENEEPINPGELT
nr:lysophospholipid acyltransferase family protein [Naumannella cuiyingiana]